MRRERITRVLVRVEQPREKKVALAHCALREARSVGQAESPVARRCAEGHRNCHVEREQAVIDPTA